MIGVAAGARADGHVRALREFVRPVETPGITAHSARAKSPADEPRCMVSVADVVGLLVILGVNTALAALLTRIFRVRLSTRWGSVLYALFLIPVLQVVVVLIAGGAGLGPNLGAPAVVIGITVVLPLSVGMAFDYFWQPAPEEVELPDRDRQQG